MIDRQNLPQKPGVYLFRDEFGDVIYVGKAKNLRKRVSSYLIKSRKNGFDLKLRALTTTLKTVETFTVKNEDEALLLESQLIKKYSPKYNIELRDDKRFFLLKLDILKPFPRLSLVRLKKNDSAIYCGPFPHATKVAAMMHFLTNYFQLRSCTFFCPNANNYKHCLQDKIQNCSAPCIGKISSVEYAQKIEELKNVLDGKIEHIVAFLTLQMQQFSAEMKFENAGEMRDIIENLKTLFKSSQRRFTNSLIKRENNINSCLELQKMLHLPILPKRIECFDNSNLFGNQAVASMVCFIDGKPATDQYRRYKIKTVIGIDDFASMNEIITRRYTRILNEKKELPEMILIDGGLGQLHAAINGLEKIGIFPVIFDAHKKLEKVNENQVIIVSLAKRNEEVYLPGLPEPVFLPRESSSLHLLQYLRDESHRFAISFHREYRNKAISSSVLDDIPNVGEKRKKLLLKHFGSVSKIKKSTIEEISEIEGIGKKFAETLLKYLQ